MGTENKAHLLQLAEAICDDTPVDWQAESSSNPELEALIGRLQSLAAVASGFRGLQTPENGHTVDAAPLFSWGHLEVVEKLGEGSFGEVYRASDPLLQRDVALKLRRPGPSHDEGSGRRFISEARRLARIKHDNVVTVHGADLHDGRVGLWTELIDGSTLDERLQADGLLGVHEAVSVGVDLCRALSAVHAAGLVHGDVKAANVLREKGGRIVLTDFGSGTEDGADTAPFGSPASVAPEVLAGAPPRPQSDLYSLGVLLFKLVSGQLPVPAENPHDLLDAHRRGERRSLRDLRPELHGDFIAVVERVLDPDPGNRPGSAGEMERALTGVLQKQEAASVERPRPSLWRRAQPFLLAVLVLFAAVTVTFVVTRRAPEAEQQVASMEKPAAAPANAAPVLVDVQAELYRGGEQPAPLASGSTVAPGDQLYLQMDSDEELYLYILNADRAGNLFVLFPLPGMEVDNPLPAGRHRLPGRMQGIPQDWQVTSAGGTETFLVVASKARQTTLERDLATLRAAAEGPAPREGENLRGIGGLADSASPSADTGLADRIHETMLARQESDGDVWVKRIELLNPVD